MNAKSEQRQLLENLELVDKMLNVLTPLFISNTELIKQIKEKGGDCPELDHYSELMTKFYANRNNLSLDYHLMQKAFADYVKSLEKNCVKNPEKQ